ncbi:MAG: DNA-binding protein WhiA [Clostridia bacterium]|nr:DNA-binding protein WhiA [Clostridia bacterium]
MSFTETIKQELCALSYETRSLRRAHLAGLAGFGGSVQTDGDSYALKIRTESPAIASRVVALISDLFGMTATIVAMGKICNITITDGAEQVLTELGYLKDGFVRFTVDPFVVHDEECKTAFMAGAFLGGGYVKNPESGYHFEIKTHYRDLSRDLSDIIAEVGFDTKTVMRKSEYVVYVKQCDTICDMLAHMGAPDAMFELCNVKIYKDMCNNITRKVNCDTANINKTVTAAAQHIAAIKKISSHMGLEALPESLEQIARLRLEYPEESLTELGNKLCPPISKSGVSVRLKKLTQIAESL